MGLLKSSSTCLTAKPLFLCALVSSLAWFIFWVVMAPVEKDINHLLNWHFFTKLKLDKMYDVYGALALIHYWTPLLVMFASLLSKCSPFFTSAIEKTAQVTFVIATSYNILLFLYLLLAGGKVTSLFVLTLPLQLALSLGPWLTALFLPHKLFIPVLILIAAHLMYCYMCSPHARACETAPRNRIGDRPPVRLLKRVIIIFGIPCLIFLLGAWIMQVGCQPCFPNSAHYFNKAPPPRPKLIAHRGCGRNAPENSPVSFEQATELDLIVGLETDVQISVDGVPFLLHDPHLVRTTDVRDKCPHVDPFVNASRLNYSLGVCPLKELNVGTWFIKENFAVVPRNLFPVFSRQTLPQFSVFLSIAKRSKKVIIFDVVEPPVGHTHHSRYLNITLEEIVRSGIDLSKVWWLPKHNRDWVITNFPDMVQITKTKETEFKDFQSEQIQLINDDWTTPLDTFRVYQSANISINMFFVESLFMYNYAWCIGVESVTTDNCRVLAEHGTNQLHKVCHNWYSQLHSSTHRSWWVGLTALLLLFIILLCWDSLFARVKR